MTATKRLIALLVFGGFLLGAPVNAQGLVVARLETDVTADGLAISFTFSQDIVGFGNSRLYFTPYDVNNTADLKVEVEPQIPLRGRTMTFLIPKRKLKDVASIEYALNVYDADKKVIFESPSTRANVLFVGDNEKNQNEIKDLKKKVADLQVLVDNFYQRNQAQQVNFDGIKLRTNSKLVLAYSLDAPGFLHGTIRSLSNPPAIQPSKVTSGFTRQPVLTFDNLPRGNYEVKAEILDVGTGNPSNKFYTTTADTSPPIDNLILDSTKATSEESKIKLTFNANQSGFIQVKYAEKLGQFSLGTPLFKGELSSDQYGQPQGEPVKVGPNEIFLDRVAAGKAYEVTITGKNSYGADMPRPLTSEVTIDEIKKLAFDASVPISVKITPLGINVEWKATIKPKEASLTALFANKTYAGQKTSQVGDDLKVSLELPVDQLTGVLNAVNDPNNKSQAKPILHAEMIDAKTGKSVSQDMTVTYSLPTKVEINDAVQKHQISEQTKNDLNDLVDRTNGTGGKIDWGKLLKTGLAMIFQRIL